MGREYEVWVVARERSERAKNIFQGAESRLLQQALSNFYAAAVALGAEGRTRSVRLLAVSQ